MIYAGLVSELQAQSREACSRAYAPYSNFQVGAAVLFAGSSQVFTGANVENKSYGLTICAERVAIASGVSAGLRQLTHVCVTCRDSRGNFVAGTPCGACLQVINEFGTSTTEITLSGGAKYFLCDFLPRPFGF